MSTQTVYFNNPQSITNLQRQVLPQNNSLGSNHQVNMQNFVNTICGAGTSAFKGIWSLYGNAFTNEQFFATTGTAGSDGRVYTTETSIFPSANSKAFLNATLAKMIEEGYTNTDEACSKYIPWMTGNAYYYYRIFASSKQASDAGFTGTVPVGSPYTGALGTDLAPWNGGSSFDTINPADPSTYVYQLGLTNLASIRLSTLLSFNWPMLYPFLVFVSNGAGLAWNSATFQAQSTLYTSNNWQTKAPSSGYQTLGSASALSYQKFRDWYFVSGTGVSTCLTTNPDIQAAAHYGQLADYSNIDWNNTFQTYINLAKNGTVPLLWTPGKRILDNYYYGVETIPQIYGTSDELLGIMITEILNSSLNLKGSAYPGGFKEYLFNKIMSPLQIPRSDYSICGMETGPEYPSPNTSELSFRRTAAIASTGGYGLGTSLLTIGGAGLPLGASFGCSQQYINDGRTGQTVWASEYPDDNLGVGISRYWTRIHNTGTYTMGGAPLGTLKIKHMAKLAICLANNGWYNGVQIFKPTTVKWQLSNHSSSLAIAYYSPQGATTGVTSTQGTFNGGWMRFNTDLTSETYSNGTDTVFFWGGAFGTYCMFDIKSGLYVALGTSMYFGSISPSTLPYQGSLASFRTAYGALQALQKMQM